MIFLILVAVIVWIASMALLPFGTDAPLYHFPFATIGVIVVNCLLYFISAGDPIAFESWYVWLGGTLNPLQLLSNTYMHAGIMHLVGNMIYLWAFGTVVEGKIGHVRFLILYHAIGILESGIAWLICLGFSDPIPMLGASGAIFGMLAMSLVWAPANNVICPYSMVFDQEVSLSAVAFFSLATNFISAWMSQFAMSSAMLHLLGGLFGAVLGVWMFKKGMVECEGYDLFAVLGGYAGDENRKPKEFVSQREKERQESDEASEEDRREIERQENLQKLASYFTGGHIEMGLMKLETMRRKIPGLRLNRDQLNIAIRHFVGEQDWPKSIPLMQEYVKRFAEGRDEMRLSLARIIIVANHRPRAGIKLLAEIDQSQLSEKSTKVFRQLYRHAQKMIHDGDIEIRDGN